MQEKISTFQMEAILDAAADQAVRVVVKRIARHDPGHTNKGAHIRSYWLPDRFAGHRYAKKLAEGWVGGNANRGKADEYEMNSGEKFYRCALRAKVMGEQSTYPSRDPVNNLWGGGVLVPCAAQELGGSAWILNAISGLPEKGDEAAGLLIPLFAGWKVDLDIVKSITDASGNVLARNLLRERMPHCIGILGEIESLEAEKACLA